MINLNKPLLGLDGVPIEDATGPILIGKLLANALMQAKSEAPMKTLDWARKLWLGAPLDLDKQDTSLFRKLIDECTTMTDMVRGQILEAIT